MSEKTPSAALLLNHYAALEFASEEMLLAAHAGQWDNVTRLEAACAVVIVRLRGMGEGVALTESQQRQRTRILQTIMENDLEICRICQEPPLRFDPVYLSSAPVSNLLH
ncbi:MAG: flagellar protein FliT [Pseudomonadota bacterium]